ncbi:MAG: MgtC/SapB family protein [Bacteroidales bacterium]|nr:MgtC/SapB family protein [Bacteroidales bacterium]MBR5027629.1 MgtC/SapB family protein [Bacteroidales bacterium]
MELFTFVIRALMAMLLGAGIGLERQIKQRSAGLTTNALVSIGACLFVLLSEAIYFGNIDNMDRLRVVSQIVTGIGFLGAGVIMKDGFTIHGINTAATIWCSAAVGSLCGFGMYIEAVIAAVAIVSTHLLLKPLSDFLDRRPHKYVEIKNVGIKLVVEVNASEETDTRTQVIDILQRIDNLVVNRIETTQPSKNDVAVITIDILTDYISEASKRILTELSGLENVRKLSTEVLSQRFEK